MTLRVNSLTGFGGGGGGGVLIVGSVALVESSSGSNHNVGNIDVGPASSDKNIILAITISDNDTTFLTGVTVGGVSLTEKVILRQAGTPDVTAAIWVGDISSKNGSQLIVASAGSFFNGIGVTGVAVSGLLSLTPTMTVSDSSTGPVTTLAALAAPVGGIVIACAACELRTRTATWESATERADLQTAGGSQDHRHTAAWDLGIRIAADEDVTFTGSTDNSASAGAGFR